MDAINYDSDDAFIIHRGYLERTLARKMGDSLEKNEPWTRSKIKVELLKRQLWHLLINSYWSENKDLDLVIFAFMVWDLSTIFLVVFAFVSKFFIMLDFINV